MAYFYRKRFYNPIKLTLTSVRLMLKINGIFLVISNIQFSITMYVATYSSTKQVTTFDYSRPSTRKVASQKGEN